MAQSEIIDYLSGLTGFVFDKSVLVRIARDRGVLDLEVADLDQREKDLLLADLLYTIYISPNVMASMSQSHGNYQQTVGSQTIYDKHDIYEMMIALYRKWGDVKGDDIPDLGGGLTWME